MDAITDAFFDYISVRTFWRVLLFMHFATAIALLAATTLQTVAILMPVRQAAGNFVNRVRATPAASYVTPIVFLYALNFLIGCWVKEHVMTMGVALLPAYWYFWRQPLTEQFATTRKWLVVFLAFSVWYAFLVGHVANDFRGVGA